MHDGSRPPPQERPGTRLVWVGQRLIARLQRLAARTEQVFDRVRWGLRRRVGRLGPVEIIAYRGFGTSRLVWLSGRVVEAKILGPSTASDPRWRNAIRMVRRFLSSEIPDAEVRARFGMSESLVRTDEEGYFHLGLEPRVLPPADDATAPQPSHRAEIEPRAPLPADDASEPRSWYRAELELCGAPVRGWTPVRARAEVLVPGPSAQLGIVSDIDDTVLQTHVGQRLKMIWTTLARNALTRLPFEGTTELYRALVAGPSGRAQNPVFYVSKSPWNLYDFLVEFIERQGLPRGPLLLRDIGLHSEAPLDHKTTAIEQVLRTYQDLPFILIGDSGERDPDIYVQIAARHPGRIPAIYIREMHSGPLRRRQLEDLTVQAQRLGSEMVLVSHASLALAHARTRGLAAAESPPPLSPS